MEDRIYLSPPDITGNELEYVTQAFTSNWIAPLGPNVDKFETNIIARTGAKYALALSSGTAAIHLALRYLNVARGDSVFCSSLTFSGSCNPIAYLGATPTFIDSEPDSWNMSPKALERALADAIKAGCLPKAVIIVDLYGQSANMGELIPICEKYRVPVIEDAAEALGAYYQDKSSGTFGYFGVYSFNGNKIITTGGGGMLISDDQAAIQKCRFWSTQSREKARHYEHREIGYNYRMSNVLAGIGIGQLEQLDMKIAKRKRIFHRYKEAFQDFPGISMMPIPDWSTPNYWLSVICLDSRMGLSPDDIMDELERNNIESRPVWKPMHRQPVFKEYPYYSHTEEISVSDDLFRCGVCLPSGSGLTEGQQDKVIDIITNLIRKRIK